MQKEYITQEKYNELNAELHALKTIRRKEVAEHLENARSLGDLSENAEYHEAREEQAKTEARIAQLENILKNAEIVHHVSGDVAEVGSLIVVQKSGESDTKTYTLVGSTEEADMSTGKISHYSPFGSALLKKKKGETFEFSTPGGIVEYTVVDIQ